MDNFNLKEYLAENKLLKENKGIFGTSIEDLPAFEYNFDNVKAAAKIKSGGDGFSIPYEFGTINMYNRPSGGDGTGDVGVEYESGGTTQDTDFVSYEKAIEIINNLTEGDLNENNSLNEQSSGFIKSKVENAVDGLTRKIMFTINSEKSAQEMSEIFKSVTFRMGQLLESYATYTQRVQQSNNSDDSLQKIADAEDDLDISFKKIEKDVMGRLKIRP